MKLIQKPVLMLALGLIWFTTPAMAISEKYRSLSETLLSQATVAFDAKQNAQAEELVNLALTANPANAAAFILKGRVHAANGDADEALRIITVGLEIEPANLSGLALQTQLAVQTQRFEQANQALAHYKKICAADCAEADELDRLIAEGRAQSTQVDVKSQKE